jgi:nucleotide-binding universal stress UspA family protein
MYRDLLVHVDDGSDVARLRARFAVDLAISIEARLHGLHVTPPAEVPPVYKPNMVDEVLEKISSHLFEEARLSKSVFADECGGRLTDVKWSEAQGDVAEGISDMARYADLVIVGQNERQGSPERHPLPIAHATVLRCGRPVLVVPDAAQGVKFARIIVAWDGSRESVRAVHDSLPLLQFSDIVHIVAVGAPEKNSDLDTERLEAHLRNHGVNVVGHNFQSQYSNEHQTLMQQVDGGCYDLLVMGGYSHPMWLEFIFGGATRLIMGGSKIPVLVSH